MGLFTAWSIRRSVWVYSELETRWQASPLSRLAQKYTEPLVLATTPTAFSEGASSFDNWRALARRDVDLDGLFRKTLKLLDDSILSVSWKISARAY
jgi:hypothetical protein